MKDNSFDFKTNTPDVIAVTISPPPEAPRVFKFSGNKQRIAFTLGTGNPVTSEERYCSKEEQDLFFLQLHALLADNRDEFIRDKGAEFAGMIWDEAHSTK